MGGRIAVRRVFGDEVVESSVQRALCLDVGLRARLQVVDVDGRGRTKRDDRHASVVPVDGEMFQHVLSQHVVTRFSIHV